MSDTQNKYGIPYLSGNEIRSSFIKFFEERQHKFVPSSPVFPKDDPTLLFTNAGMNQFKGLFLGDDSSGLKRAVNSQKVIRVSGKHNDLDEVGRDNYHHTFFEMLGNWSFGDYFKKEAIKWAWELITEVWQVPKSRLFATIYKDDDEAYGLWQEVTDIDPKRILRFEKDNFWEMGEVGPCGPCTEIFFDLGPESDREATYSDPVLGVNGENDRYVEIMNLVFMQYERLKDSSLKPLKAKHVDTGAGFERLCSVIQGSGSNYETDVFTPIIEKISELTGSAYSQGEGGTTHRVIADHVRALTFAVADGATPGNEGRGYVLRRILRRACRYGRQLGMKDPFIFNLVPTVAKIMGEAYPEVSARCDYISEVLKSEEVRFLKTLDQGIERFEKIAETTIKKKKTVLPGADAFLLYDTYGFPLDLTRIMAEEKGLSVNEEDFNVCMEEQRERARGAQKFDASFNADEEWTILSEGKATEFTGYEQLTGTAQTKRFLENGDDIFIVLDKTPFYAEAGGQIGDSGVIKSDQVTLRVIDTFKVLDMTVHRCHLVEGLLSSATVKSVSCEVDQENRELIKRNHSATHLLHEALRSVLGDHVTQQGSRVSAETLRFDFTHHSGISPEEIEAIEDIVNREIQSDLKVATVLSTPDQAKQDGALALFGEKYGDEVRVVSMGGFSKELCGGTHVDSTGQIGALRITSESSIAAGIRRIEAITGPTMVAQSRRDFNMIRGLSLDLKVKPDQVPARVRDLTGKIKDQEKELKSLRKLKYNLLADELIKSQSFKQGEHLVVIASLNKAAPGQAIDKVGAQQLQESLSDKLQSGISIFTHTDNDFMSIFATVAKSLHKQVKAGDIVKQLATLAEGRGGGRPDRAQGGTKLLDKEELILTEAKKLLQATIGKASGPG